MKVYYCYIHYFEEGEEFCFATAKLERALEWKAKTDNLYYGFREIEIEDCE